jgi:ferredoxin
MASEPEVLRSAEIIPLELKQEPRSKGITTPRKKKPKELAVITECCTGCAGSPACVEYCPVEDCMFWVPDEDHPPFGRIQADARSVRARVLMARSWMDALGTPS